MKIYLSSIGIPDIKAFEKCVGKTSKNIRFCLIFNAFDYKSADMRLERFEETVTTLNKQGLTDVTELNLRHFDTKDALEKELRSYDVIWLNGGNVFLLRWLLEKNECDKILVELANNNVVIAGDSAGAVVMGPTLKHYDSADDPNEAKRVNYTGLSIIDTAIIPHWRSEKYQSVLGELEKNLIEDGYSTKCLSDGEFMVVNTNSSVDRTL